MVWLLSGAINQFAAALFTGSPFLGDKWKSADIEGAGVK
jgi:hypothetical protein